MRKEISTDGTILLSYEEGHKAVIIPSKDKKRTVCLSCMIGCPLGCPICCTNSFKRELNSMEMISQVKDAIKEAGSISSVVFMGMGEPMLNHEEVFIAIERINSIYRIPFRRITLSTVGIELSMIKDKPFLTAISLHSPFDDIRKKLVFGGCSVLEAVSFSREARNGLMVSYALIDGLNDRDEDLEKLLYYDWDKRTNFNLLEFNSKGDYTKSSRLTHFKEEIRKKGFKCFIRMSRGHDIDAACGMLNL